jgi:small subunit ribosomal protein S20
MRSTARRAVRNKANLTRMKSLIKRVRTSKAKADGAAALRVATKFFDELAAKGVIHKNKAANQKSKLAKFIAKLS